VVAADPETVAVSTGDDHFQPVVPELRSARDRQRAAVQGVHAVGVDVAGQVGGAADSADGEDLMRLQAQLGDRRLQRVQDAEVSAARAPVGVGLALEVLDGERRPSRSGWKLGSRVELHLAHGGSPQTRISWTGTYFFV